MENTIDSMVSEENSDKNVTADVEMKEEAETDEAEKPTEEKIETTDEVAETEVKPEAVEIAEPAAEPMEDDAPKEGNSLININCSAVT